MLSNQDMLLNNMELEKKIRVQDRERARQILEALDGMSICQAQKVLDACKDALQELLIKY